MSILRNLTGLSDVYITEYLGLRAHRLKVNLFSPSQPIEEGCISLERSRVSQFRSNYQVNTRLDVCSQLLAFYAFSLL